MLVIRLSRTGKINSPAYNIIITEKRSAAKTGKVVEKVGYFISHGKGQKFKADHERIRHWILRGAQPSSTLARLLHRDGMKGMDEFVDFKKKFNIKKADEKSAEATAKKAEAPAAA